MPCGSPRRAPDLVLMDLRMPALDGARPPRGSSTHGPTAKVLVLTTYETDEHILGAIEAGATATC